MTGPSQGPPKALHERLLAFCRHRTLSAILIIFLVALILVADLLLPSAADYGAFLLVPLLLATYCGGWKFGVSLGWVMVGVEQYIRFAQVPDVNSGLTAVINFVIWGVVASLVVALTASALEARELRESYVRLRTLQQTMVTVNDIVRNRLSVLLALCDVIETGYTPTARQVHRSRSAIEEIVHLLDRLGRLEVVNVTEVAVGIEAVDIDASVEGGSNVDKTGPN
jgi:ABC-type phosphate/phosphonate transport system permease subunit